ncbi:conserved protein of unknown function [Ectopseudomonas oleovorans]|uniref:Uncharacterized protein n=1 Tax=Ectopseudomonas oleovorans TaxID=301 RepID=A0A653B0P8_ECTOL|nr:conserved protein of unknown function [Pseudomonas oleovorans]
MTAALPYYLGCPSWSEAAWRATLYPDDTRPAEFLTRYVQVFNAVEGNTTFYARPSEQTVARWAQQMPEHFRFCAKLPREISHSDDLCQQLDEVAQFRQLLAPLGARVQPYWLQLPASFAPSRLAELASFIENWGDLPLAIEVRHPEFFAKGDAERLLNRLLHERGIERVCLDSRALFSCESQAPAVLHAQAKKPRLPTRPTAFSQSPQLRFIGHPELLANDPFMLPWLDKVAGWIEHGLRPYVFAHTSDNRLAPELARRFHQQLMQRLPGLPELPVLQVEPELEQLGLL